MSKPNKFISMCAVANIVNPNAKIAFVLESPHIDEVFHKYPLAGTAGREMSRHIFGRYDIPFGLISLKTEISRILNLSLGNPYSVLNISQQPLQRSAYEANSITPPSNIISLEKLKQLIDRGANFQTNHREKCLNAIKASMFEEFKAECEARLQKHNILIPCGRFAQTFCEQLHQQSNCLSFELMRDIPHPSRGGWSNLDSRKLNEIKRLLQ